MIPINDHLKNISNKVPEVSVLQAFEALAGGGLLVDIREDDEVVAGSPTGALRITKGLLEMQIQQHAHAAEEQIMLLCASGKRSLLAAHSLQQLGYTNVYSVNGGFTAWKNQSLPFEIPQKVSKDDLLRYKRHIIIPEMGEKGQLKLLQSKVLLVGAGGIGSPVALYLAAAGIGCLGIIDRDVVDRSNLQRQILFSERQIDMPKVEAAKERLDQLNTGIKVQIYNERLDAGNIEQILSRYDLVIDGTDNFETRYLINDACVKLRIPNIHGSVFLFEGQFSTFWPASGKENAPCYRCLFPTPPPPEIAPSCSEAGVLGVLPGMIGVLCATEAIKILLNIGENQVGRLLVYDALKMEFNELEISKRDDCPYCGCKDMALYPPYSSYAAYCAV